MIHEKKASVDLLVLCRKRIKAKQAPIKLIEAR